MEQKSPWSLKEALGYIKKEYDVCLIDTRPVFDVLTKNALYAADVLLTPVKFDNFCRDNLAMVEDAYHELKEKNPELKWKVFANMVANVKAQKVSSADLLGKHDYPFLQSCISRTAIVDNALSLYKPVAKHELGVRALHVINFYEFVDYRTEALVTREAYLTLRSGVGSTVLTFLFATARHHYKRHCKQCEYRDVLKIRFHSCI